MSTIRQLLSETALAPGDEITKTQVWTSLKHKRALVGAVGDDGILTLVIRKAFERTYEFIKLHSVVSYDPDSHAALIDFVCNGTYPRPVGDAAGQPVPGGPADGEHAVAATARKPRSTGKGSPRRSGQRRKAIEVKDGGPKG